MRVLFTIPHYFRSADDESRSQRWHGSLDAGKDKRVEALTACLASLHQLFRPAHVVIEHRSATASPVPAGAPIHIEVVLCTTGDRHVLQLLPRGVLPLAAHHVTNAAPELLGFACHDLLRDRLGQYDYYCYLEDDLVLHDPLFFLKLSWFNRCAGDDKLLQPHRFEAGLGKLVPKVYVDGDLDEQMTAPFQDIRSSATVEFDVMGQRMRFERTLNPHAGCFFLNARQMDHWARQPHFTDRQARFIGPLESAASLGIMRTFQVYKPALAQADFLEIQHHGTGYLDQLRLPEAKEGP